MRMENGTIILKENELVKALFAFCRPSEYADRCRYNGKGNDFEKCETYQILSAIFPDYKKCGDDWKGILDSATEDPDNYVLCPIIRLGFKEGKTDKEYRIESANSE